MLITLASWGIISLLLIAAGLILSAFLSRFLRYDVRKFHAVIILGIVGATIYAETFSIFDGVGKGAVLLFSLLCALGIVVFRKEVCLTIGHWDKQIRSKDHLTAVSLFVLSAFIRHSRRVHILSDPGGI